MAQIVSVKVSFRIDEGESFNDIEVDWENFKGGWGSLQINLDSTSDPVGSLVEEFKSLTKQILPKIVQE